MSAPYISYWAEGMVRASWQGGLALGLGWVAARLFPCLTPRVRCWLWRLAYLKLVIALLLLPSVTLRVLPPSAQPAPIQALSAVPSRFDDLPFGDGRFTAGPVADGSVANDGDLLSGGRHLSPAALPFFSWLLATWIAGLVCAGARMIRQWVAVRQFMESCDPAGDERLLESVSLLCGRLRVRRIPRLLVSHGDGSPLLVGGAAPAIVLPSRLIETCSPAEIRLMLAHELAHLKRRDLLWGWLPALAHGLYFFHPMVWVANREWRVAQEMACDELSVQITNAPVGEYGTALLKVAAHCRRSTPQWGLAAIVADEFPYTLKRRLKAMKTIKPIPARRAIVIGAALVALGTAVLVPWRVAAAGGPDVSGADQQRRAPETSGGAQNPIDAVNATIDAVIKAFQSLGLSNDQNTRIAAIFSSARGKVQSVFSNGSLADDQKFPQIKQIMGAALDQVRRILTPDQQKRFGEMTSKGESGNSIQSILGKIEGVNKAVMGLGLTDAQKTRIQPIFDAAGAKVQAILGDGGLTEQEKTNQAMAVIGPVMEQVRGILTPEQFKKLNAIMSNGKSSGGMKHGPLDGLIDAIINNNNDAVTQFARAVGLSSDQQTRLRTMVEAAGHQVREILVQGILNDSTLTNLVKKQKISAIIDGFMGQMEMLLTPDQRAMVSGSGAQDMGQFPMEAKFVMDSGPTDDQAARVKAIFEQWHQKVQAITGNASLPDEQKAAQVKEADLRADQQLRGILTADQNKKLTEMRRTFQKHRQIQQ